MTSILLPLAVLGTQVYAPRHPEDTGLRPAPLREWPREELHGVLSQGRGGWLGSRPGRGEGWGGRTGVCWGSGWHTRMPAPKRPSCSSGHQSVISQVAGPRLGKPGTSHTHIHTPGDTHTHTHCTCEHYTQPSLYQQHVCTTPNPHECSDIGCPRGLRRTDTCPVHECRV